MPPRCVPGRVCARERCSTSWSYALIGSRATCHPYAADVHPRSVQELLGQFRLDMRNDLCTGQAPDALREVVERLDRCVRGRVGERGSQAWRA